MPKITLVFLLACAPKPLRTQQDTPIDQTPLPTGQTQTPTDTEGPIIDVTGPLVVNTATITLAGTAEDGAGVASVTLGGSPVASVDNFAHWQIMLTLTPGDNTFTLQAFDKLNNAATIMVTVKYITDNAPPSATIVFPPPSSSTEAATISVRGTASDVSAVSSVTVNGVNATSTDGFKTWQANVPVSAGNNVLSVNVQDMFAQASTGAATAALSNRGPFFARTAGLTRDGAANRLLTYDSVHHRIVAIAESTGDRSLVCDTPALGTSHSLLLDAAHGRVLLGGNDSVAAVALNTCAVSELSGTMVGTGPLLDRVYSLTSYSGGIAAAVQGPSGGVFGIDLTSGNRTLLSASTGAFSEALNIVRNAAGNGFLVSASSPDVLLNVADGTGNTTVVSSSTVPNGTNPFSGIWGIVTVPGNKAVTSNYVSNSLVSVDLSSGARTVVSSAVAGTGPQLINVSSIATNAAQTSVYGIDDDTERLLSVNLSTGDRTVASQNGVGAGRAFEYPRKVVVDAAHARLIVADERSGLSTVSFANSARAPFAGSGATINLPGTLALDASNNRVFVTGRSPAALYAVDLDSGALTTVAVQGVSGCAGFQQPSGIALDTANARVFAVQESTPGSVSSINLNTGSCSLVTGASAGTGPALGSPRAIELDGTRLLVSDSNQASLFVVDPTTGARSLLSTTGVAATSPRGMWRDAASHRAFFIGSGGSVYALDLQSNVVSLVSGPSRGVGVGFSNNVDGLTYSPALDTVFILDYEMAALVAVDVASGDRVVLSK